MRASWQDRLGLDPHHPAGRARIGLLGIAASTIVAAGITAVFFAGSDNHNLHVQQPGSPPPTGAIAGAAFGGAQPGDCMAWSKPGAVDLTKVDCTQPHKFEVAADIDLSKYPGGEFATGTKFPGQIRFAELNTEHCAPAVATYLGGKFDPNGKFKVGMINPGAAGWAAGERTLRCGLQDAGPGGQPQPIVGTVANQDQSNVLPAGKCYGINQNLPTDPVECDKPHAWEVVSTVDLASQFTGAPPSEEEQKRYMGKVCQKAAAEYLGAPDALRNKTLTIFYLYISPDSWLGGSRKLNCMIGQAGDNGFAQIVGSAKGNILINGQAPIPPPPLPSGRR